MLPVVLSPHSVRIGVAGKGEALAGRLRLLDKAGVAVRAVFDGAAPEAKALRGLDILFIAGLDGSAARDLYVAAKQENVLVNVEDVPKFCDFHVPAMVTRGDLLITVSTGGRSPGLASQLRVELEDLFGPEWENHLEDVAKFRARLRSQGFAPKDIAEKTRAFVDAKGWIGGSP